MKLCIKTFLGTFYQCFWWALEKQEVKRSETITDVVICQF